VVADDDVIAYGNEVVQIPVAALLPGKPDRHVIGLEVIVVENAHAGIVNPDGGDSSSPDHVVAGGRMHGPIFIQDAVAAVVINLAVLHHQVLHRSIRTKPVAFGALHVPSGVVQITVPHFNRP